MLRAGRAAAMNLRKEGEDPAKKRPSKGSPDQLAKKARSEPDSMAKAVPRGKAVLPPRADSPTVRKKGGARSAEVAPAARSDLDPEDLGPLIPQWSLTRADDPRLPKKAMELFRGTTTSRLRRDLNRDRPLDCLRAAIGATSEAGFRMYNLFERIEEDRRARDKDAEKAIKAAEEAKVLAVAEAESMAAEQARLASVEKEGKVIAVAEAESLRSEMMRLASENKRLVARDKEVAEGVEFKLGAARMRAYVKALRDVQIRVPAFNPKGYHLDLPDCQDPSTSTDPLLDYGDLTRFTVAELEAAEAEEDEGADL